VQGVILALASRPQKREEMSLSDSLNLSPEEGVSEDYGSNKRRQISFLDESSWDAACFDIDAKLPWQARRANVFVRGLNLLELKGKSVHIGLVEVEILGEVVPCHQMELAHIGLENALRTGGRGGVYGRILNSGVIRIGDEIRTA